MSRLHEAQAHLEKAVARLERAVELSARQRAERGELARALNAARAEGKSLREAGASLSSRLDSAIGRLKSAIEAG
jgi:hypothetical protein